MKKARVLAVLLAVAIITGTLFGCSSVESEERVEANIVIEDAQKKSKEFLVYIDGLIEDEIHLQVSINSSSGDELRSIVKENNFLPSDISYSLSDEKLRELSTKVSDTMESYLHSFYDWDDDITEFEDRIIEALSILERVRLSENDEDAQRIIIEAGLLSEEYVLSEKLDKKTLEDLAAANFNTELSMMENFAEFSIDDKIEEVKQDIRNQVRKEAEAYLGYNVNSGDSMVGTVWVTTAMMSDGVDLFADGSVYKILWHFNENQTVRIDFYHANGSMVEGNQRFDSSFSTYTCEGNEIILDGDIGDGKTAGKINDNKIVIESGDDYITLEKI